MIDDVWWDANSGLLGESQVWPSTQPRPPPLLTRSRFGKYIAAHRLFKSSERTQMAWGCRYILALSQRAHLTSLDGGSVAKGYESSCGGKIVVAPVGPARRWPPGEGMFSSQIKGEKKRSGLHLVLLPMRYQGHRTEHRASAGTCTSAQARDSKGKKEKSITSLKSTERNCRRGWFMGRNLGSSSASDPAAASVSTRGPTLLLDLLLDPLLVSELI